MNINCPPGHPGISPTWTSSAKSGVGASIARESRIWFTISNGIVSEMYYPELDQANTKDLQFLVSDGRDFFSEEKLQTKHEMSPIEQGAPAYKLINTCKDGRFRITKTILTDPHRDVLLQKVQFEPLRGSMADYHLYVLLSPHINNRGYENSGWVGDYKGMKMLFAQRESTALALACSEPFVTMSCGYVGISDGWQDINSHKRLTACYSEARNGNIALTGEVDLKASGGNFILALAFGENPDKAGLQAKAALLQNFDDILNEYISEWQTFQSRCYDLGEIGASGFDLYRTSTAVLKTHESKSLQGAMIASLSIPWGEAQGDDDIGGYHLVWPRDLVESAEGLLAAGNGEDARRTLFYLICTQDADGHWPQNMWLNGKPYWRGVQMDETAFPILLAAALKRMGELKEIDPWPMVLKAASFLVRNGPVTQQDRWEEEPGYSPFTLAVEVSALLNAADFAEDAGNADVAKFLSETADIWNEGIERWTYTQDTELSRKVGVDGYYVRITPPDVASANSPAKGFVPIKNRPPGTILAPAARIVSMDALALVRFGLRSPHDPRIINTLKVIDSVLKTETSTGPVWHRYNQDVYGEHDDGSPFDGDGIGRGWPLLAGERAHYELAAGNSSAARKLLKVIEAQMSQGGFIPEQVWDAEDISRKGLKNGRPSGSAMPLVWAHAEYIKLLRSLRDGKVFDMPIESARRYREKNIIPPSSSWRFNNKSHLILEGKNLRVEVLAKALVHWSDDGWKSIHDQETLDSGLGLYYADLPTNKLRAGSKVVFTFFWSEASTWEGINFEIEVTPREKIGPDPNSNDSNDSIILPKAS